MQVEWRQQRVQACEMAASCSSGGRWSGGAAGAVGKEEGDLLRTVDCLRGRLQAERVASRVAREESDLMAKKVAELERLMAIEIRARDRAEKMLKSALKKLQSLKLPDLSGLSGSALGDSSSSDSASCLGVTGKGELSSPAEDFGQCRGDGGSSYFSVRSARQSLSQETRWSSAGDDDPRPRQDVESKAPMDGEVTSDHSTSTEGKDQSIHEIDDADASPGSVSSSFRLDTEKRHRPIASKSCIEKTQTEVEGKADSADGKWQLGNNASDVLFSLRPR